MLTSCSRIIDNIRRSADDRLIDSHGFSGKKRLPTKNKKYVDRARYNIERGNLDDERDDYENDYYEQDEIVPYRDSNRRMYQDMAMLNRNRQKLRSRQSNINNNYPKLSEFNKLSAEKNAAEKKAFQKEITLIKKMLEETNKQISTYKCPMRQEDMNQSKGEINDQSTLTDKLDKSISEIDLK